MTLLLLWPYRNVSLFRKPNESCVALESLEQRGVSICAWFRNWELFSFVSWDNQAGRYNCFPAESVKALWFLWHWFEDPLPSSVKTLSSITLSRALETVTCVLLGCAAGPTPGTQVSSSFTPKSATLEWAQLESVCSWPTPSPDWPGTPLVKRTNSKSRAGRLKNTKMHKENYFQGRSFSVLHEASADLSRVFLVRSLGQYSSLTIKSQTRRGFAGLLVSASQVGLNFGGLLSGGGTFITLRWSLPSTNQSESQHSFNKQFSCFTERECKPWRNRLPV